jgi:hypothetical protein
MNEALCIKRAIYNSPDFVFERALLYEEIGLPMEWAEVKDTTSLTITSCFLNSRFRDTCVDVGGTLGVSVRLSVGAYAGDAFSWSMATWVDSSNNSWCVVWRRNSEGTKRASPEIKPT